MGNIKQLLQLNNGVTIYKKVPIAFPLDLVWRGQKCCDVSQRLRPTKCIAGQRKVDTLMCGRQGQESGGQRGCHQRNGPQQKKKESWRRWTKSRCLLCDDSAGHAKEKRRKTQAIFVFCCVKRTARIAPQKWKHSRIHLCGRDNKRAQKKVNRIRI